MREAGRRLRHIPPVEYAWEGANRWRHALRRRGRGRPPVGRGVIVYQMGQVGSTSIVDTLRALHLGVPIYHEHFLAHGVLDHPTRPLHRRLRDDLRSASTDRRWSLVTAVRDPVAQDCGAFIRNLAKPTFPGGPDLAARYRDGSISIDDVVQAFLALDRRPGLTWFDVEMRRVFDIDVYSRPFDHAAGYSTYEGPSADLLLVRLETMDETLPHALAGFLGLDDDVPVFRSNQNVRSFYRTFLAAARLPDGYLDLMYSSRMARHFYTDAEIAAFRRRWQGEAGA